MLEPIFSENQQVYISALTELELFSHMRLSEEDEARLEAFLETVPIMPLTSRIGAYRG